MVYAKMWDDLKVLLEDRGDNGRSIHSTEDSILRQMKEMERQAIPLRVAELCEGADLTKITETMVCIRGHAASTKNAFCYALCCVSKALRSGDLTELERWQP